MQFVFKMHVRDTNNVGRTSPCVFSTEELAFKWAAKHNEDRSEWTIEMILLDNYNQEFIN